MKKIQIGKVYSAHCYSDGVRIKTRGHYHFRILEKHFIFNSKLKRVEHIYLGLKLDVEYSPYEYNSQAFWFDGDGVHNWEGLEFRLQRKINEK